MATIWMALCFAIDENNLVHVCCCQVHICGNVRSRATFLFSFSRCKVGFAWPKTIQFYWLSSNWLPLIYPLSCQCLRYFLSTMSKILQPPAQKRHNFWVDELFSQMMVSDIDLLTSDSWKLPQHGDCGSFVRSQAELFFLLSLSSQPRFSQLSCPKSCLGPKKVYRTLYFFAWTTSFCSNAWKTERTDLVSNWSCFLRRFLWDKVVVANENILAESLSTK